jgi:hypothetical protein
MGQSAAIGGTAGPYHLAADIVHTLTAAVWIGPLVGFLFLLRSRTDLAMLHGRWIGSRTCRRCTERGRFSVSTKGLERLSQLTFLQARHQFTDRQQPRGLFDGANCSPMTASRTSSAALSKSMWRVIDGRWLKSSRRNYVVARFIERAACNGPRTGASVS